MGDENKDDSRLVLVFNGLDSVSPSLTAPTDASNHLDFVSFPPVSAVHSAGDVVSLEAMLFKGKLEYDFDVTLGKAVAGNLSGKESSYIFPRFS